MINVELTRNLLAANQDLFNRNSGSLVSATLSYLTLKKDESRKEDCSMKFNFYNFSSRLLISKILQRRIGKFRACIISKYNELHAN